MHCASDTLARRQSFGEEMANSISHGVAVIAALVALPVLVAGAVDHGRAVVVVGAAVFGATMVLLYLTSTLYHALPQGKAKRMFLVLDHCAIFLFIAGTYTPFTLGVLGGAWGWSLFGVVWGLAVAGIVLKGVFGARFQALSISLYLAMGWLVVIAAQPLLSRASSFALLWLAVGGAAYTIGVFFFVVDDRVRYAHFVWHLLVMAGSACHFIAVFAYV